MKALTTALTGIMSMLAGLPQLLLAEEVSPKPFLDPLSQFTAVMFIGAALLILLWKTLPQMGKDSNDAMSKLAVELRGAIEKMGADVKAGQEQVAKSLLETVLKATERRADWEDATCPIKLERAKPGGG